MININNFINMSKNIHKIFDLPDSSEPEVTTIKYTDKLGDTSESLTALKDALSGPSKMTLLTAPTGSGKTTLINQFFETSSIPGILFSPTRLLTEQNGECFDMNAVFGNIHTDDYVSNHNSKYSVVFDKYSDILNYLKKSYDNDKNFKVNLIIDEAHLLIESINFRENCIHGILDLINYVKSIKGSVLLISATIKPLAIFCFDRIINFISESYSAPADKLYIVRNHANVSADNVLTTICKSYIGKGFIPFVRLNNKKTTDKIIQTLSADNLLCSNIDSDKKNTITYVNDDNEIKKQYANPMYASIAGNNSLPGYSNDKKIDAYFTTSLMDVGVSIESIDGEKNNRLLPIFYADYQNMSETSIIQFFNRIRYKTDAYMLVANEPNTSKCEHSIMGLCTRYGLNYTKNANQIIVNLHSYIRPLSEDSLTCILQMLKNYNQNFSLVGDKLVISLPEFHSIEYIARTVYDRVQNTIKSFQKIYDILFSSLFHESEDVTTHMINQFLKASDVKGQINDQGCIYYDSSSKGLTYSVERMWKVIVDAYNHQFYFFPDKLVDELSNELNIPLSTVVLRPQDVTKSKLDDKSLEQILDDIEKTPSFQKELKDKIFTSPDMQAFSHSDAYDTLQKLMYYDYDLSDALTIIRDNPSSQKLSRLYKSKAKEIINSFTTKDIQNIQRLLSGKSISPTSNDTDNYQIVLEQYKKILNNFLSFDVPIEKALNYIVTTSTEAKLQEKLYTIQCKEYNKLYIKMKQHHENSPLPGTAGAEQTVVLNELVKFNNSGNLIQRSITDNQLSSIAKKLESSMKAFHKKRTYSVNDVYKLIHGCFITREQNGKLSIVKLRL